MGKRRGEKSKDDMNFEVTGFEGADRQLPTRPHFLYYPRDLRVRSHDRGSFADYPPPLRNSENVPGWWLLDGGSIVPILAMGLEKGDRVLDVCAAPGGKSLAMLLTQLPGKLVCNDAKMSRLGQLKRALSTYIPSDHEIADRVILKRKDATDIRGWDELQCYDKVLADVPCSTDRLAVSQDEGNLFSATNSNLRMGLPQTQTKILVNSLRSLRVGGSVIYSTCTLSPSQNEAVVENAAAIAEERFGIKCVEESLSSLRDHLTSSGLFRFSDGCNRGILVLPFLPSNFGPIIVSVAMVITNTVCLLVNIFLFIICIMQILANFIVLYVWTKHRKLYRNDNLILLVSLAFIDFLYAVEQFPYLIILMMGHKPDNEMLDYDPATIIWVGGPSAALMKGGCTITSAIALDRIFALYFPVFYYQQSKKWWSIFCFIVALTLAGIDWLICIIIVPIQRHPGASNFGGFVTHANRVAFYILIVSTLIGVVPGLLNGFGLFIEIPMLNEISFFVGTCATLSGLSHAFIFAMAHREIRYAIGQDLCGCFVPPSQASVSTMDNSFVTRTNKISTPRGKFLHQRKKTDKVQNGNGISVTTPLSQSDSPP
ncbi:hypothetical protein PENTCL1PPCAC_7296, partial [Pristionchus entomophagus]